MPLDPVLVLIVVNDETGLVVPLLQTLHRHPGIILMGNGFNLKHFKTVLCTYLDIVERPSLESLEVVWLPLPALACSTPECLSARGVGGGDPDQDRNQT